MIALQDIDFNANVKIEDVAPPDRLISGFALEMFGSPLAVRRFLQRFHEVHAVVMHHSDLEAPCALQADNACSPPLRLCTFNDM